MWDGVPNGGSPCVAPWAALLHQLLCQFTTLALEPRPRSLLRCGHVAQHPWPRSLSLRELPAAGCREAELLQQPASSQ